MDYFMENKNIGTLMNNKNIKKNTNGKYILAEKTEVVNEEAK